MKRIDCLGKRCPQPIIDVAQGIKEIELGQSLILIADDPATLPDLKAWARMSGHTMEVLDKTQFLVTRQPQKRPGAH